MSLQTLLESANPYHSVQSDAARLAEKWEKTGLLEGLNGSTKNNMGIILENQAKQLVVESSQTGGGTASTAGFTAGVGEQWAGVALPLVRKVFGQIAAQEFVSVQPMNLPSGLVFFLDFQYGTTKGDFASGDSLYGDVSGFASNSTTGGLYGAGRFGYSINNTASSFTVTPGTASWADLDHDGSYSGSGDDLGYRTVTVDLDGKGADLDGARGFILSGSSLTAAENLPRFTSVSGTEVTFVIATGDQTNGGAGGSGIVIIRYKFQ